MSAVQNPIPIPISNSMFHDAVRNHVDRVAGRLESREAAKRRQFQDRFLSTGIPTAKDEEWKYTSLRHLEGIAFQSLNAVPDPSLLNSLPGLGEGPWIVFWNGRLEKSLCRLDGLPDLEFSSLAESSAPAEFGEIAPLEGRLGSTNDDRFLWLNQAGFEDGAILTVAAGVALEKPIQVVFLSSTSLGGIVFPRLFVRLEEGASASLVEYHAGKGPYVTIPVAEVSLARGAALEHIRVQEDSESAVHIGNLSARQGENSTYTNCNIQFGSRIGRIDANVWVGGEHAETWLDGVYVGNGEQHLDNHTRIDHAVPNCHSFEVYKGILDDRATGVFNGKIFVYQDAQKTDAKQTNQALLLSPTSTVDTKPQLEIFADDVKCTHGATVGQLREDALFYLRSRGIPASQARNLLVYAFAAEVLERIKSKPLREALEARLFVKLGNSERM